MPGSQEHVILMYLDESVLRCKMRPVDATAMSE